MIDPAQLSNVQGNILAGFNKDHQLILALHFASPARAKVWVGKMAAAVATHDEVAGFNALFKAVNQRRGGERGVVESVWTQLLLSASGLEVLGVTSEEIAAVSAPLKAGMAERAGELGDQQESDPASWIPPFGTSRRVHAMLVVAADAVEDLHREADRLQERCGRHEIHVLWHRRGDTLPRPFAGHEHFGFKDGVSQPQVDDPGQLPQYLLGHTPSGQADPWGATPLAMPAWAQDGSLIAFRVLHQNVDAFRSFAAAQAEGAGLTTEALQAKLVGRWKSGAPLAQVPAQDDPTLAHANDFDYADDLDGNNTPRFAHIRKSNPRAQTPPGADESARRRILRRGIPYGHLLPREGATDAQKQADRGLLFFCAQASLENQFEFIQKAWCNDPNFPQGPEQPVGGYAPTPGVLADGADPIIGQHHGGGVDNLKPQNHALTLTQFVTMRGGEYFIAPSVSALTALAQS